MSLLHRHCTCINCTGDSYCITAFLHSRCDYNVIASYRINQDSNHTHIHHITSYPIMSYHIFIMPITSHHVKHCCHITLIFISLHHHHFISITSHHIRITLTAKHSQRSHLNTSHHHISSHQTDHIKHQYITSYNINTSTISRHMVYRAQHQVSAFQSYRRTTFYRYKTDKANMLCWSVSCFMDGQQQMLVVLCFCPQQ
jgi:hypothetical protein